MNKSETHFYVFYSSTSRYEHKQMRCISIVTWNTIEYDYVWQVSEPGFSRISNMVEGHTNVMTFFAILEP